MLFWSNIHGGCLSGIGLLVIYIVGEFLNKKPIKKYILTLIACLGVLFINPYGFEYVKFLFHAGLMDRSFISEWHSAFDKEFITKHLEYKAYLLIMLLTQVIYFIKTKAKYENIDKTKLLIILAMTYLSVKHIRHQAFFAFTVGTLLYDEFYYLINSAIKYLKEKLNLIDEKQFDIIVKAKEILIYTIILAVSLPALLNDKKEIKITESEYPRYAIEFIELNKITGNLLLNFDWGSYAAYKLYPNNLIVMDGRYEEVYDPKLLVDLRNFHLLEGDWYKIVRDYKTDVMILEKKYPVYEKILENKEWTLIFENNLSGVFVPTNTVKEEYKYPIPVDDYYNKTLFHTKIKF